MKNFTAIIFIMLVFSGILNAQDSHSDQHQVNITVPALSLLDIEGPDGNNTITLEFEAPEEAGLWLTAPSPNSDLYLNLSSTAKGGSTGKTVAASISSDLPAGITLKVVAAASATGKGNLGSPTSEIALSTTPQNVITGVKTGYTGDGVGNGFQLTYTFAVEDTDAAIEALTNDIPVVTVTYTMTGE